MPSKSPGSPAYLARGRMNFRFTKNNSTGKEQIMIIRTDDDTDETLENFASTLKGSKHMIHTMGPSGIITLVQIIVTLEN